MEITIKINGQFMSVEVSAEVADYLEQARRNNRKLYREQAGLYFKARPTGNDNARTVLYCTGA